MLPHSSHLFVGQWRNRAARAHQRPSAALTVMDFEWEQNWELGKIAGNSGKQFWERLATSQTTGCSVSPCPQASESTFRTSLCHVSAATVWYIWYCLCVPLALCLSKISESFDAKHRASWRPAHEYTCLRTALSHLVKIKGMFGSFCGTQATSTGEQVQVIRIQMRNCQQVHPSSCPSRLDPSWPCSASFSPLIPFSFSLS